VNFHKRSPLVVGGFVSNSPGPFIEKGGLVTLSHFVVYVDTHAALPFVIAIDVCRWCALRIKLRTATHTLLYDIRKHCRGGAIEPTLCTLKQAISHVCMLAGRHNALPFHNKSH
jgi:hypothetical protein